MEFHPFADCFTLLAGREMAALVADVRSNGLRQEIVLYQGKILDGRNRFLACQKAGVEPRFVTTTIASDDEARRYVESVNDRRRHQDPEARKAAVLRLRAEGKSTTQIAEEVGVCERTVRNTLERSTSDQSQVEHPAPPQPKAITGKDGKKRPPKKAKPAEVKERKARAKKKKKAGKSVRQIAKEEGVSVGTVQRDLVADEKRPTWSEGDRDSAARLRDGMHAFLTDCRERIESCSDHYMQTYGRGQLAKLEDLLRSFSGALQRIERETGC